MNEEFPDLEAPNLDFPNDNLAVAYEFFLNYYLHPYDIAVELFDFPDVIKEIHLIMKRLVRLRKKT